MLKKYKQGSIFICYLLRNFQGLLKGFIFEFIRLSPTKMLEKNNASASYRKERKKEKNKEFCPLYPWIYMHTCVHAYIFNF